ncbi:DUF5403 family protein [Streptomyces sp. NRRL S-1813]|uniref:DUF5403 family protein n=1 Tax=Streptomyces sp. NRRL S-1813 TaxID=1463888 RepID=UPI0004C5FC20|nr:DUF5403 family protein [Streptomyces sp. NRRL S-1813]
MASVDPNLDRIVAHLPQVKTEVSRELSKRAARVRAVVNAHRDTGELAGSLEVETSTVDSTVSIADPAVVSINYGHWTPGGGTYVEGIHAIEAGLT